MLPSSHFKRLILPFQFYLVSISLIVESQNEFRAAPVLAPSRNLLPSFTGDQSHLDQALMLDNFKEHADEGDWSVIDSSCKITAQEGKLFNQSMHEELIRRYPNAVQKESNVQIRIPDPQYNDWLIFDKDTFSIQGVPLKRHVGMPYHFVVTVSLHGLIITTLPCEVEVVSRENTLRRTSQHLLHWKPSPTDLDCLANEPVVCMVLRLDVENESLTAKNRIRLLKELNAYMKTLSAAQRKSIALEIGNIDSFNPFLSGHGNIQGPQKHFPGVGVVWMLGCGSDSVELTGVDVLEKSSQNGTIAQLLGYDVVSWRVENRKPLHQNVPRKKRFKRQVNLGQSKSPTVRTSYTTQFDGNPGYDPNFDLGNNMGSIQNEEILNAFLSDEQFGIRSFGGRTRIPNHMIKKSPVVTRPRATPIVPDPPKRFMIPPSTPYISNVPLSRAILAVDEPPEKDAGIGGDIGVFSSTYFEFEVPKNAFRDDEDGDTRSLSLRILDATSITNSSTVKESTWLMLDHERQVLYGVPPGKIGSSKRTSYGFLLIAKDRSDLSTTDMFAVHLADRPKPTNHRFVFILSHFNRSLPLETLVSIFARRLSTALDSTWSDIIPPGKYTILKSETTGSRLLVSWFDNSLGSKKKCDANGIRRHLSKMTGQMNNDLVNARLPPDPEFGDRFQTDFNLKSIKIVFLGPCLLRESEKQETAVMPDTNLMQPPMIVPPPPRTTKLTSSSTSEPVKTTTTMEIPKSTSTQRFNDKTYDYSEPFLNNPNFLFDMATAVGKENVKHVDEFVFFGGPVPPRPGAFWLKLESNSGSLPSWLAIDSDIWSVVALPQATDVSSLDKINATHRRWLGKMLAEDEYGRRTDSVPVNITVALPPSGEDFRKSVTHSFKTTIKNYVIQNFTVLDSMRFLNVIKDLFGDDNTSYIYVHPLQAGSVVFSWHNISLQSGSHCPYKDVAELSHAIFDEDRLRSNVYRRLLDAGFDVTKVNLIRKNACKKRSTTPITTTTARSAVTTKYTTTTTTATVKGDLNAGGMTSTVIVIVVLLCLLILLIIVVIKCRGNAASKKKKNDENTTPNGVILPSGSPFLLEGGKKNGESTLERRLRLKPGTPIVFEGEVGNGGTGIPLLQNHNNFTHQRSTPFIMTDNRSDDNGGSSSQLIPNDEVRPPPPPYVKSASST